MKFDYLSADSLSTFITRALEEDIRDGDHSSLASIPSTTENKANLLIKGNGILAGVEMAKLIFNHVDSSLQVTTFKQDGDDVKYGDIGLTVSGKAQSILTAERLVLNCMQRMSGIATYTHQLATLIKHYKSQILDTRKTTPNFRIAEKWAVKIGGGTNHRYGLFDMIMLKDNHIDFAGGIENAIDRVHTYLKEKNLDLDIEIETRNLTEVEAVLKKGGVDVIMLDNMSPDEMVEAIKLIDGRYKTEASGGITEDTLVEVAKTGVDFISIGALTHSVKSMDISLKAV